MTQRKAIVTGVNGTVGPVVAEALRRSGCQAVAWDRTAVPPEDELAVRRFFEEQAPDWLFHLAVGSPDWTGLLAQLCAEHVTRFLFTGSVSVFSRAQRGPLSPETLPEPEDDYGRYKLECEQRIRSANPDALIVRIGWQIGHGPGSNNMVDYLHREAGEDGRLLASTTWFPACSFLDDTAASLLTLMERYSPGLYHLDGNPGLSFYEIARHLARLQKRGWEVLPAEAPAQHNLMVDERVEMPLITRRFEAG